MGSTPSLGLSGRSVSPSSISSSNVRAAHPHGLRPSASFHSQSRQRSGYGERMGSPPGKSGRAQVSGMPSSPPVESFGGNWTVMGSGWSELILFLSISSLSLSVPFLLAFLYRSILTLPIPSSTLNINISLCIRLQLALSAFIRAHPRHPHRVFRRPPTRVRSGSRWT